MELEMQILRKSQTDEHNREQYHNEERKIRIKAEKTLATLQKQSEILMNKLEKEEAISKEILEQKLNLQAELQDTEDHLAKAKGNHANHRQELIKQQVRNSQLHSDNKLLDQEEKELKASNNKLIG